MRPRPLAAKKDDAGGTVSRTAQFKATLLDSLHVVREMVIRQTPDPDRLTEISSLTDPADIRGRPNLTGATELR